MRWLFPQYQSKAELEQRRETLSRIDAWWDAFRDQAKQISDQWDIKGAPEVDLPKFMSETLHRVDERIMWEYGPAVRGPGHRLVITPESERGLRAMVDTLLDRAPELPGWEFYGYRLPESVQQAGAAVYGRTNRLLGGVMVRAESDQHHMIGLTFLHPDFTGPDDKDAGRVAFVAAESLLGESYLDRWIGFIECDRLKSGGLFKRKKSPAGSIELDRLKPTVDAMIDARRDQLLEKPLSKIGLHEERPDLDNTPLCWGTLKIDPPVKDDYPTRSDLFVAVTCWVECFRATFTRRPFDSSRFSKHGEVFCYLKTDGRDGFSDESWDDRGELEDDLQSALDEAEAGCVWGGGTGRIYSYVEFALTDMTAGAEAIRKVLQKGNIHRRTWILFHDQDMRDEWIGAYDDTPAPPTEAN